MSTKFSQLSNCKVGIWGFGVEGQASYQYLLSIGNPQIVIVGETAGVTAEGVQIHPPELGIQLLAHCSYVIKSPGISRYDPEVLALTAAGVRVVGGLGLWLNQMPAEKVICVTGTKGKSTTSAILAALLTGLGYRCFLGGNIGSPPWHPTAGNDFDFWVIETSSYQVTDIQDGPGTVVVTSLSEDHLPWHLSPENYYRDKLSLATKPRVQNVLAATEPGLNNYAKQHPTQLGNVQWVSAPTGDWAKQLELIGAHNLQNAGLAEAVLQQLNLPNISNQKLAEAATNYQPLSSRLTKIAHLDGVDFIDDSLSTNALPTIAALASFPDTKIALIVGGEDRGIDYQPLAAAIKRLNQEILVLTIPDNGARIGATITETSHCQVQNCPDLPTAVNLGFAWAKPAGVVLLSPAAPSFGIFKNYQERAEVFRDAVIKLDNR